MIEFSEKSKIVEPFTQESFNFYNKIYGTNWCVFREVGNQKFTTAKRQKYANGTTLLVIDLNKSNEISEETLKRFLDNKALKQIEIAKTFCNRYNSQAATNVGEDAEVLSLRAELRNQLNRLQSERLEFARNIEQNITIELRDQLRDQLSELQSERQEFERNIDEQHIAIASIVEDDCYTSVEQNSQNEFIPQQQIEHTNNVLQHNLIESSNLQGINFASSDATTSTNKRPVFHHGKPLRFSFDREDESSLSSSSSSESSLEDTDCRIVTSEIVEPIRQQTQAAEIVEPIRLQTQAAEIVEPIRQQTQAAEIVEPIRQQTQAAEIVEPIREQTQADDIPRAAVMSELIFPADDEPKAGTSKTDEESFIKFQQYLKKAAHTLQTRRTGETVKQQDFKDNQFNIYEFHFHLT